MYSKPIIRYFKRVDKGANKILIPKEVVEKFGREFYLEVYVDKLVLVPVEKKEG